MRWRPDSIILYAFDLMHLNGKDLRQQALSKRRLILKDLLGSDEESRIQFSEELMVTVMPFSKPALSTDLKVSFPSMHWHNIGVGAPRHG